MFIAKLVHLYTNKQTDNESCINNDFNKGWLLLKNYNKKKTLLREFEECVNTWTYLNIKKELLI